MEIGDTHPWAAKAALGQCGLTDGGHPDFSLFRSGAAVLTYLAYGTKDTNDVCYHPRSNTVYFRGVGLMARLEPVDYSDGEPG